MTPVRMIIALSFVLLIGVPIVFRPPGEAVPAGAARVIIVTPHNEQIRREFGRAFSAWHEENYGTPVEVVWNVPGGTSEIRKMLQSQFEAALEQGRPVGGSADLVFGGGSYEHGQLKRGVTVVVEGVERSSSISTPVEFDQTWLQEMYGENVIGNLPLYDPELHWFGTALSGFGIVYNHDVLAMLGTEAPRGWGDLGDPAYQGWVALVNPGQSGSVTTAFEAILHRRGWNAGWRILRRAGANARYFSGSSLKPPADVGQGDAALGVCIDFYGRYQAQSIKANTGHDRLGYIDPPRATTIDPDPISMLHGAPNEKIARRFIEFSLSETAQALWQFRTLSTTGAEDGLGPVDFELRRMPVRRSMYAAHMGRMIDPVNPFEIASGVEDANGNVRSFIAVLFAAMVMDTHEELKSAWEAIVTHPAYEESRTDSDGFVVAQAVSDPTLSAMLELFDALPVVTGPRDVAYPLSDVDALEELKAGWLRGGWSSEGLWHESADPENAMRRSFVEFFRNHYERIVEIAEGSHG